MWLAHYRAHITFIWAGLIGYRMLVSAFRPVFEPIYMVFLLVVVAALLADLRHLSIVCTRCAEEFPLDGAVQAVRRMALLRGYHKHYMPAAFVQLVFVVLSFWLPPALIVAVLMQGASVVVFSLHRRLTRWCPYCRDWNGRYEVTFVIPPTPTGERTQ